MSDYSAFSAIAEQSFLSANSISSNSSANSFKSDNSPKSGTSSTSAVSAISANISAKERESLLSYQAQFFGREVLAAPPGSIERRPISRPKDLAFRDAEFEIQSVLHSERMFLVVLAIMTSVLGAICVYFVLNI